LVLAAAQWRLGLIDEMDLRREIVLHKVTGWETFYLQPNEDSLGGIAYRPLHKDNLSPEELFTRELRHLFARVFCQDEQTSSEGNLLQGVAPYTGTAGSGQPVVYGNENMRFFNTLESMAAAAERCRFLCVKPTSPAAAEISSLSSSLVRAIEELKIYSEGCTKLKPVVHFLDWSCRMMEPMSAERTFHAHAQAYRLAARLVREASLNTKQLIEGVSAAACLS
jgi:hypothetical protein